MFLHLCIQRFFQLLIITPSMKNYLVPRSTPDEVASNVNIISKINDTDCGDLLTHGTITFVGDLCIYCILYQMHILFMNYAFNLKGLENKKYK